jgi:hypothetical protein
MAGAALVVALAGAAAPASAASDEVELTTSDVELRYTSAFAGAGQLEVTFAGKMGVARVPGRPARERWDFSGMHAAATKGGGAAAGAYRGLDAPVFVERDGHGAPARLAFSPRADAGARQLVEYLVGELRVPQPAGRARWRETAHDATGSYEADWSAAARRLQMTKRSYAPQAGRPDIVVATSTHELVLSPAGALDAATVRETLRLPAVQSETTAALTMKLASRGPITLAESARAPAPDAVWFAFGTAHAATQREKDEALMERTSRAQALERLRTTSGSELFKAVGVAAAFARQDAGMVPALAAGAGGDPGQLPLPRAAAVLLAADTEAADAVLARWLGESGPRAIAVSEELLLRRAPSPALLAALEARAAQPAPADPLWRRATLALGAATRALAPTRAAEARAAMQRLLAIDDAAGVKAPEVTLAALGNTHSPAAFDRLRARLASRDAGVASAAAVALGAIEVPAAANLLDQAATRVGAPAGLRVSALRGCGARAASSPCATPARLARTDADAGIRRAALDATSNDAVAHRALLAEIAAHDADEKLRAYAAQALATPPPQPASTWHPR